MSMKWAATALVVLAMLMIGLAAEHAMASTVGIVGKTPNIKGELCVMLNTHGNFIIGKTTKDTSTLLVCKASVKSLSVTNVVLNFGNTDLLCASPQGFTTTNWKEVIKPNGDATLKCHAPSSPDEG